MYKHTHGSAHKQLIRPTYKLGGRNGWKTVILPAKKHHHQSGGAETNPAVVLFNKDVQPSVTTDNDQPSLTTDNSKPRSCYSKCYFGCNFDDDDDTNSSSSSSSDSNFSDTASSESSSSSTNPLNPNDSYTPMGYGNKYISRLLQIEDGKTK